MPVSSEGLGLHRPRGQGLREQGAGAVSAGLHTPGGGDEEGGALAQYAEEGRQDSQAAAGEGGKVGGGGTDHTRNKVSKALSTSGSQTRAKFQAQ